MPTSVFGDMQSGYTAYWMQGIRHPAISISCFHQVGLSTTLVVTLQKGLNDHELGKIIDYALTQPCVRGVTFQPTQMAGSSPSTP